MIFENEKLKAIITFKRNGFIWDWYPNMLVRMDKNSPKRYMITRSDSSNRTVFLFEDAIKLTKFINKIISDEHYITDSAYYHGDMELEDLLNLSDFIYSVETYTLAIDRLDSNMGYGLFELLSTSGNNPVFRIPCYVAHFYAKKGDKHYRTGNHQFYDTFGYLKIDNYSISFTNKLFQPLFFGNITNDIISSRIKGNSNDDIHERRKFIWNGPENKGDYYD